MAVTKEPADNESWSECAQENRNDFINRNTTLNSIENDATGESRLEPDKTCSVSYIVSPIQKHISFTSKEQDDGIIIEDDFGLAHSPLQRLSHHGYRLTNFDNEDLRSPQSLIFDLEPFNNYYVERYGKIDDCHSPSSSISLGLIPTPMDPKEKRLEKSVHKAIDSSRQQSTTAMYQSKMFNSRPVENGIFVVNHKSVVTPAISSRKMTAQPPRSNWNHSRTFKRKRSLIEENESSRNVTKYVSSDTYISAINCRCSKTMCLKLYCECFQNGRVCREHCECTECKNTLEESGPAGMRTRVIRSILSRKPNAFHNRMNDRKTSCACKSSKCLKKYCQCFVHGRNCYDKCVCQDCNNRDGLSQRHIPKVDGNGVIESKKDCLQIRSDDESASSISQSINLDKLDALIEYKSSSSIKIVTGSHHNINPTRRDSRDPEGYTTLPPNSRVKTAKIPTPGISDVFKIANSHTSSTNGLSSREIPIPEVFLSTNPPGSVPPDVFTNPNYWLPWTSSASKVTSSSTTTRRKGPDSYTRPWPR